MWIAISAISGALAVALGAFGAHGLRGRVPPDALAVWQTASQYHLLHSAVLLALALYGAASRRALGASPWLFTAGMTFFSGSLYALALGGPRWLGPVTPLGGLALIAGWLSLLWLARQGA